MCKSGAPSTHLRRGAIVSCAGPECEFHNPLKNDDPKAMSLNYIYKNYINNAKNRGYTFNITLEDFKIFTADNCFYCGLIPSTFCLKKWKGRNRTKNKPFY